MKSLNIKAFAMSFGVVWGLCLLFLGWGASLGLGTSLVETFSSFYVGFSASFLGGIIGAIWGFILGLVVGAFIAFFYNFFSKNLKK